MSSCNDEDSEFLFCEICGGSPCDWDRFGDEIKQQGASINEGQDGRNSIILKAVYKVYRYLKFGHLGKGVSIHIPTCVLGKIREPMQEPDGNYMGHMDS